MIKTLFAYFALHYYKLNRKKRKTCNSSFLINRQSCNIEAQSSAWTLFGPAVPSLLVDPVAIAFIADTTSLGSLFVGKRTAAYAPSTLSTRPAIS